jgi:hypothetical protein
MAKLLATFLASSALAAVCTGAVAVYWLGDIDPKFRDSLDSAFRLELISAAITTVVGTIFVAIALTFVHSRAATDHRSVVLVLSWGIVYPLLLQFAISPLIGLFDPESLFASVVGWAYLIGFPLLIVAPLVALASARSANGQPSAL